MPGTRVLGWRNAEIHRAILASFGLAPNTYSVTQLRYDLRKLKAHGLIERDGKRYAYRLTDKGTRRAQLFVLFHQRVCGPIANSLSHHRPAPTVRPSAMPPAATTGTEGTASMTAGSKENVAAAARLWPPASLPCTTSPWLPRRRAAFASSTLPT
jgi:hypothetical protein